ncbi:hypothetical protein GCK32_022487 [Trichostrongylus colubriformis]|uniref:Uncharacterized protein n=1 Tax=Trichostrongylus colubriformis TaxID=6319 RepID=A0AAN8G4J9_TRICO
MIFASVARQGINLKVPYDWQVEPSLLSLIKKSVTHDPMPLSVMHVHDLEETAAEMQPTIEEPFDTNQSIAVLS